MHAGITMYPFWLLMENDKKTPWVYLELLCILWLLMKYQGVCILHKIFFESFVYTPLRFLGLGNKKLYNFLG